MKKEFKIDKEIYSKKYIKQAIIDYKDIAEINFNDWLLIINWDKNDEIIEIFNEFMNYVIWLSNEQ